ncbi:hypothetical protein PR048_002850 [Dryococelus australis]|uniref:CST complex subunit CTC1 n=1 Tax=Dryococelus australis TaxID=614101 RepID=A0ABQ9INN3_9NEOP|nr:hypothetical protein PR048_002850 [Dryococelus australis]
MALFEFTSQEPLPGFVAYTRASKAVTSHCCCPNTRLYTVIGFQDLAVKTCPNLFTHHKLRRNERAGKAGDPRENPSTNGIVYHDSHMPKSGVTRRGLNPACLVCGGIEIRPVTAGTVVGHARSVMVRQCHKRSERSPMAVHFNVTEEVGQVMKWNEALNVSKQTPPSGPIVTTLGPDITAGNPAIEVFVVETLHQEDVQRWGRAVRRHSSSHPSTASWIREWGRGRGVSPSAADSPDNALTAQCTSMMDGALRLRVLERRVYPPPPFLPSSPPSRESTPYKVAHATTPVLKLRVFYVWARQQRIGIGSVGADISSKHETSDQTQALKLVQLSIYGDISGLQLQRVRLGESPSKDKGLYTIALSQTVAYDKDALIGTRDPLTSLRCSKLPCRKSTCVPRLQKCSLDREQPVPELEPASATFAAQGRRRTSQPADLPPTSACPLFGSVHGFRAWQDCVTKRTECNTPHPCTPVNSLRWLCPYCLCKRVRDLCNLSQCRPIFRRVIPEIPFRTSKFNHCRHESNPVLFHAASLVAMWEGGDTPLPASPPDRPSSRYLTRPAARGLEVCNIRLVNEDRGVEALQRKFPAAREGILSRLSRYCDPMLELRELKEAWRVLSSEEVLRRCPGETVEVG